MTSGVSGTVRVVETWRPSISLALNWIWPRPVPSAFGITGLALTPAIREGGSGIGTREVSLVMVTQLSLAPKNNVPAFAKYLISYVRRRHTPFHEALQTGKSITINLKGTSSEYYNEDEEFLRLMISIY